MTTVGNSATAWHDTGDLTIAKPAGVLAGDLLVAFIAFQSYAVNPTMPCAGWTIVRVDPFISVDTTSYTQLAYRVADGSEGASFVFTAPGDDAEKCGGITAIRDCIPDDLFLNIGFTTNTNTCPSVFTVDGALVLRFLGLARNWHTPGYTWPAGQTELWEVWADRGGLFPSWDTDSGAAYAFQVGAGATGAVTPTSVFNHEHNAYTLAAPAAAATLRTTDSGTLLDLDPAPAVRTTDSGVLFEIWPQAKVWVTDSGLLLDNLVPWPAPVPPAVQCSLWEIPAVNVAARYFIKVYGQDGVVNVWLDDWDVLEFENVLGDVGYYTLGFYDNDAAKQAAFELDGLIEVWRSIPGVGLAWYCEFRGLHRAGKCEMTHDGRCYFTTTGVALNDLLSRPVIAYDEGTPGAKVAPSPVESVMKKFVLENCGALATQANGRARGNVYPGFTVQADGAQGILWEGDRAFQNLLSVLRDLATFGNIDFQVVYVGPQQYRFETYVAQLGQDKTYREIDPNTGRKTNGLLPVLFASKMGTVQDITYDFDRRAEVTAAYVLGEVGGVPVIVYQTGPGLTASPWHSRELAVEDSQQSTVGELAARAAQELEKHGPQETFDFVPLQTPQLIYGRDYALGDRVSAMYQSTLRHKRITGVKITLSDQRETVEIRFSDQLSNLYE